MNHLSKSNFSLLFTSQKVNSQINQHTQLILFIFISIFLFIFISHFHYLIQFVAFLIILETYAKLIIILSSILVLIIMTILNYLQMEHLEKIVFVTFFILLRPYLSKEQTFLVSLEFYLILLNKYFLKKEINSNLQTIYFGLYLNFYYIMSFYFIQLNSIYLINYQKSSFIQEFLQLLMIWKTCQFPNILLFFHHFFSLNVIHLLILNNCRIISIIYYHLSSYFSIILPNFYQSKQICSNLNHQKMNFRKNV